MKKDDFVILTKDEVKQLLDILSCLNYTTDSNYKEFASKAIKTANDILTESK